MFGIAVCVAVGGIALTCVSMSVHLRSIRWLQAVIQQVQHDHALLKERVGRLGGPKATARLEAGLAAARAAASNATTPMASPRNSPHSTPTRPQSSPGTPQRSVSGSPEALQNSPGGRAVEAVDPNEAMAWELLYNLKWQLPTVELEAAWKDATGETAVMQVSCFSLLRDYNDHFVVHYGNDDCLAYSDSTIITVKSACQPKPTLHGTCMLLSTRTGTWCDFGHFGTLCTCRKLSAHMSF